MNSPDLPAPHILRSVSNVRMKRIFSSHSSCHAVLLSVDGDAYIIGRNEQGQCGLPIRQIPASSKPSGAAVWDAYLLDPNTDFSPALPAGAKGQIVYAACVVPTRCSSPLEDQSTLPVSTPLVNAVIPNPKPCRYSRGLRRVRSCANAIP